jgi:hypothetical protein
MNSLKSLYNRICKVETSVPPKRETRDFHYHLLTEQEQEQARAFMDSLPINIMLKMDLRELTDEQVHTLGNWLRLEEALQKGDTSQAEIQRIKLDPSYPALQRIIDRFLSLDISSLPDDGLGPFIDKGHMRYHFSRKGYQSYESFCEQINEGHALEIVEDLYRWVEYFA